MLRLMGDFETTTTIEKTRVWASCLVDIDTAKVVDVSNSIDGFFDYIKNKNSKIWFHNLKFDGEFILSWLLNNGFEYSDSKEPGTFNTLITDTGQFYFITVYFQKFNRRYHKAQIFDSLKKLPFKVSRIAEAFKLEESKLEIDYKKPRPERYQITQEERDYIVNDCLIVAKALKQQFDKELTKMTASADALAGFKDTIGGPKHFEKFFPILDLETDSDIRRAYKGGFTWLNPKYKNKHLGEMLVFDVNSLYPSVMYSENLPLGRPIFFQGKPKPNKHYPLTIQRIRCEFKLKKGKIPTIQLKNNHAFVPTDYLESSNGEIVDLTLTNVDLEMFLEHYDVWCLEYISGYKFQAARGMFKKYIDYWMEVKQNSTGGLRELAKLMLNSLYGKFATNPQSITKYPYLKDGVVKYGLNDLDFRNPVYTAMGCFITAYARAKTINTAQIFMDSGHFVYSDTDSIHLRDGADLRSITIHPSNLGDWKLEGKPTEGLFLRAKTYMETIDGEVHIKCAGMPENVKKLVTYDNFAVGAKFPGKLLPKRTIGGVVLVDHDFTIKK